MSFANSDKLEGFVGFIVVSLIVHQPFGESSNLLHQEPSGPEPGVNKRTINITIALVCTEGAVAGD